MLEVFLFGIFGWSIMLLGFVICYRIVEGKFPWK